MPAFTDAERRQWVVHIDVNALRRVRDRLDLNLMDIVGGPTLDRVAEDPVLLVDILYVLCEPAAAERGVSVEAFGESLRGDVLDAAVTALLEALADFCPSQKGRLLRQLVEKGKAFEAQMLEAAEKRIASGEVERAMASGASGKPSTDSPASPGSTPAP